MAGLFLLRSLSRLTFVGLFGGALGSSGDGLNGTKDTWGMQNPVIVSNSAGRGVGLRGAVAPLRSGLSLSPREGLMEGLFAKLKAASSVHPGLGQSGDSPFAGNSPTEAELALLLRSLSLLTVVCLFGAAQGSSGEGLNGTQDTWGVQNQVNVSDIAGPGDGLRGAFAPLRLGLSLSPPQGLLKEFFAQHKAASSVHLGIGESGDSSFAGNDSTETQLAEFVEAFGLFDRHGDGQTSTEELGPVLRSLGHNPTAKELQDASNKFDSDRRSTLELHEIIAQLASEQQKTATVEELRKVFTTFDCDANHSISAAELHAALTNLGEKLSVEEIEAMIREADMDHDRRTHFEEFVSLIAP